jgi:hypothetical protein
MQKRSMIDPARVCLLASGKHRAIAELRLVAKALVRPGTGQEAKAIAGDVRRLGAKRGARRP